MLYVSGPSVMDSATITLLSPSLIDSATSALLSLSVIDSSVTSALLRFSVMTVSKAPSRVVTVSMARFMTVFKFAVATLAPVNVQIVTAEVLMT